MPGRTPSPTTRDRWATAWRVVRLAAETEWQGDLPFRIDLGGMPALGDARACLDARDATEMHPGKYTTLDPLRRVARCAMMWNDATGVAPGLTGKPLTNCP